MKGKTISLEEAKEGKENRGQELHSFTKMYCLKRKNKNLIKETTKVKINHS